MSSLFLTSVQIFRYLQIINLQQLLTKFFLKEGIVTVQSKRPLVFIFVEGIRNSAWLNPVFFSLFFVVVVFFVFVFVYFFLHCSSVLREPACIRYALFIPKSPECLGEHKLASLSSHSSCWHEIQRLRIFALDLFFIPRAK